MKGDKTRTAANREQGNPQASGAQTSERHVLRVECYESVLERVVGGHSYHSILFAMGGWGTIIIMLHPGYLYKDHCITTAAVGDRKMS